MKNFKDITLSIFAIIGFVTILSSFNNQSQETHSTVPEYHVWEAELATTNSSARFYLYNKVTGEVRRYKSSGTMSAKGDGEYIKMYEIPARK